MSNTINNNITKYIPNAYKVKYTVTEEKYEYDGKIRITYGINAYFSEDDIAKCTPCLSVHDISSDRSAIADLVDTCNRSHASLEHIYEIIDNFYDVTDDE